MTRIARFAPPLLTSLILLAACGSEPDPAAMNALDNSLAGNATDPALTAALGDQIMVDPQLAGQAAGKGGAVNGTPAVPPGPQPSAAELGALAKAPAPKPADQAEQPAAMGAQPAGGNCTEGLGHSMAWAAKLPAELPIFPKARVREAAGKDDAGCRARAVSFATAAPIAQVVDFYYTRATKAGFSAEHLANGTEHVLGGVRARDGGAYYLLARPLAGGGTEIDLVTNNGQ